ncbi:MAG TPA: hypothetical protein DCM45_01700 [Clostridiales bacterium]|nr:hypothetical protein [Clostridiales bacterium]
MILTAFILGLLWGFLRKIPYSRLFSGEFSWHKFTRTLQRRFDSVFRKHFRWLFLLILSFIFDILRSQPFLSDRIGETSWFPALRITLAILQYGTMLAFLYRNNRKPGMILILAGSLLNGLAIVANSGQMPVSYIEKLFDPVAIEKISNAPHYFIATGGEPLMFLADIIPFWIFGWNMISIGDIPILAGIFLLAGYLPRRIVRPGAKKVEHPGGIEYTKMR